MTIVGRSDIGRSGLEWFVIRPTVQCHVAMRWKTECVTAFYGVLIRYDDWQAEMPIDYSLYLVTGRDLVPDGIVRCFGLSVR